MKKELDLIHDLLSILSDFARGRKEVVLGKDRCIWKLFDVKKSGLSIV